MKRKFLNSNAGFLCIAGACMALALSIAAYLSTGCLILHPNMFAAK